MSLCGGVQTDSSGSNQEGASVSAVTLAARCSRSPSTRVIGALRALEASRWRVRRAMADESLLISLDGTLACILAGLLIGVLWILGMRETTFPGMSMHLPVAMLETIAVLGVVIGVAAAIIPARRAAKLDPLAALRHE